MKSKKILVCLATLLVAAALTACGNPDTDKVSSGSNDEETTTVKVGVVGESNEMWVPVIEEIGRAHV